MRDPNRLDDIYEQLHKIHKETFPDWRMFQFMSNFFNWVYAKSKIDPFYIEDNKFMEYLNEYKEEV